MYINLDLESQKPIYTQLKEQIISGIARGDIVPNERLPSVRNLASDIGINLHTVRKAYQQLQKEGYILIHRQKGVVVHPDENIPADETYMSELKATLDPIIAAAICHGLDEERFKQLCEKIYKSYKRKDGEDV